MSDTCPHCGDKLPESSGNNWQMVCPKKECQDHMLVALGMPEEELEEANSDE